VPLISESRSDGRFFGILRPNFTENDAWSLYESLLKIRLGTESALYNLS
jgi:hypothetical protein